MDIKKLKIDFKSPTVIGIVLGFVLFIVIMAVYYYMVYSGLTVKLNRKEAVLRGVRARYSSYLVLVKSYPMLVKKLGVLNKEFAYLIRELPPKKDIPGLLMKISNYEKALHLNLKMFKPGRAVPKGFYEAVPFSMNISGDFYNVYKFFYKLASMRRIVDVHSVSITKGSNTQKVSVGFKGTTFSFIGSPTKKLKKSGRHR